MSKQPAKRVAAHVDVDDSAICYWKDEYGLWWIYFPGGGAGVLSQHTIIEHEDQTITVTPSILTHGHGHKPIHGFLTRGVWEDC